MFLIPPALAEGKSVSQGAFAPCQLLVLALKSPPVFWNVAAEKTFQIRLASQPGCLSRAQASGGFPCPQFQSLPRGTPAPSPYLHGPDFRWFRKRNASSRAPPPGRDKAAAPVASGCALDGIAGSRLSPGDVRTACRSSRKSSCERPAAISPLPARRKRRCPNFWRHPQQPPSTRVRQDCQNPKACKSAGPLSRPRDRPVPTWPLSGARRPHFDTRPAHEYRRPDRTVDCQYHQESLSRCGDYTAWPDVDHRPTHQTRLGNGLRQTKGFTYLSLVFKMQCDRPRPKQLGT